MNRSVILSGEQLVAKGATKIDATLPECGLKDVIPNGSWLEQKQIQAALEARKDLIEAQRIEKCGVLSHAEWREELMLAEVTRKVGSYWQYIGHNVGKQLFLYPEEALFLMEVNCLLLKHNDITVSLQQAYSLLLCGKISIVQYKVYASLSRLGYRVFRYRDSKLTSYEKKLNLISISKNNNENNEVVESTEVRNNLNKEGNNIENTIDTHSESEATKADSGTHTNNNNKVSTSVQEKMSEEENLNRNISELPSGNIENLDSTSNNNTNNYKCYSVSKLQKLRNRQQRLCAKNDPCKYFENIPDLFQNNVVTVKAPESQYLPSNISLNNRSYVLNLDNIKKNTSSHTLNDSRTYSISDEVNGAHVRRVRSSSVNDSLLNSWVSPLFPNTRFPRHNPQFRPFNFWRPRSNFNFFHFNLFYQRPFFSNFFNFSPRFQFYPRTPPLFFRPVPNLINFNMSNDNRNNIASNSRKRTRDRAKSNHLEAVKKLASRLKLLIQAGNRNELNIQSLHRLLQTYNNRYKTRLHLTEDLDIINNERIVETIELDDDEESRNKRSRLEDDNDNMNENLNNLRQLALRLKDLEAKGAACARHRRSFSNIIKTFNKSYNAEIYVNNNYEIFDGRHITLESSSDSDCVIEETPKLPAGKKLRNPFNILKRLSEKQNSVIASTSKNCNVISEDDTDVMYESNDSKYSELLLKTFNKNWLPNENDFGRAEVSPRNLMHARLMGTSNEEFLFDFMSNQPHKYDNWLDMKIAFWKNLEQTEAAFQSESLTESNAEINSLIKPEDCKDMTSILKKLSIIQNSKDVRTETNLEVHFDVYNKDVQNFRKSNPPKPHFRIICVNESLKFPSGADIAALHSKHDDNVGIVFAVVGVGSISYMQINPTDLPVYIPSNDLP